MAGRGRKRHNRKPNDVGDARMGSVNQQQLINQSNSQSSNTGNSATNSNITSNKCNADTKTNDTSRSLINGVLINDGEMPGSSRMNNRDRDGKSSGVIQQMSTLRLGEAPAASSHLQMARKLPPSKMQEPIKLVSNVFPLYMEERAIYRYDVKVSAESVAAKRVVRCLSTLSNDCLRQRKCLLLLQLALERYRRTREMAYIYDTSAVLFTNEQLDLKRVGRIVIEPSELSDELRDLLGNNQRVYIEISEPSEYEAVLSMENLNLLFSGNNDNKEDISLKQFFEIITKQSPLVEGTHYLFGDGRAYLKDGRRFGMRDESLGCGYVIKSGCSKGVRFIDNADSGGSRAVPALVLDSRKAVFYDCIPLMELVEELWNGGTEPIELLRSARRFDDFQQFISRHLKDVKVKCNTQVNKVLCISQLSTRPVGQLSEKPFKASRPIPLTEIYRAKGIRIRADLPAVVIAVRNWKMNYPIEILSVQDGQRVTKSKMTNEQISQTIRSCAVRPGERYGDVLRHLEALNLHESGDYNKFMRAFGVKISQKPLEVIANRVKLPSIVFAGNRALDVDRNRANWRSFTYVKPAIFEKFYVGFDDPKEKRAVECFVGELWKVSMRKGIQFRERATIVNIDFGRLEDFIKDVTKKYNGESFLMYIDDRPNSHEDLKLFELKYQIITQHVQSKVVKRILARHQTDTLEGIINKMNAKNYGHNYNVVPSSFGRNKWLTNASTLVIGYDVCHPEPQSARERRLEIANEQPSVIGFSYNCGESPETFVGDYAFHEARKEQVTGSILEGKMFYILEQFQKVRGVLPEFIIITRDGVSEQQMKMVMRQEFDDIKAGVANFCDVNKLTEFKPKFLLSVTTKRHDKRFFARDSNGIVSNTLPGTVVDRTVTRADCTEVFMQAHRVIQGTAKLPDYTLLINDLDISMDEYQSIMMSLCYTHQIINSAISIPEPIYQADEWAKRGRNNFRAYKRYLGGKIPRRRDGTVDWNAVTHDLCYENKRLANTRSNA